MSKKSSISGAAPASCACFHIRDTVRANMGGNGMWRNWGMDSKVKGLSFHSCVFPSQGVGSNLGQQGWPSPLPCVMAPY